MDINCTYDCDYQVDGKCSLTDLTIIENINFEETNEIYCPYRKKQKKAPAEPNI